MNDILEILLVKLKNTLESNQRNFHDEDILTTILLTKATHRNLLNLFEESSIFKYELFENPNLDCNNNIKELEELNLVSKIKKNDLDKYFINLNGIYYYLNNNSFFNIENFIKKKNEELFPVNVTQIKINSQERVFIILLILLGATSSDAGLQTIDKDENDFLFDFVNIIYRSLLESNLFSFNEKTFSINWNNKKNKNFESFKLNVDSATMYGIIKLEKNHRLSSNWYVDLGNENLINTLIQKQNTLLGDYEEAQKLIALLYKLKKQLDTNYYFKRLPDLSEKLIEKIK